MTDTNESRAAKRSEAYRILLDAALDEFTPGERAAFAMYILGEASKWRTAKYIAERPCSCPDDVAPGDECVRCATLARIMPRKEKS
jgi:hypothetical protein